MAVTGRELEREFEQIVRDLGGDLASRDRADAYIATTQALYHDGPINWGMSPKIFTGTEIKRLAKVAETTYSIMEKVTWKFLADEQFRKLFGMDEKTEKLCLVEAGYDRMIPYGRVDIFLNEETGEFQFCELNTDGSAGICYTEEVTRAIRMTDAYAEFERRHPSAHALNPADAAVDAVLETYASWEMAGMDGHPKTAPALVFVDYDEGASHGEYNYLAERFLDRGVAARFADIRSLHIVETDRGPRLADAVGVIDCIWRRALINDMNDMPCKGADAMVAAAEQGLVCLVGSFRTWPVATKPIFAVLWSGAADDILSEEEIAFVKEHVPETYMIDAASDLSRYTDKDAWIAKPLDGYNSVGVLAGQDATDEEWMEHLHKLAENRAVVQKYAPQYATPLIVGGEWVPGTEYTDLAARSAKRAAAPTEFLPANNMEGLYIVNGKFGGIFTRCGYLATIGEWTNRYNMGCIVVDE